MVDWTKPIQTRDGREARVLATDVNGTHTHVVVVTNNDGKEYVNTCTETGLSSDRYISEYDIINKPERKSIFCNTYDAGFSAFYNSLSETRNQAGLSCLAQIEIVLEDGKPIEAIIHPIE